MTRRTRIVVFVIIPLFTLPGCMGGVVSSEKRRVGMNMQDAAGRADGVLDEVLKEIQPEVHWIHGPTTTGSCDVTRRRAVMTIVSAERRGSFLGIVDRFWSKRGYKIKAINNDPEVPAIFAQTEDGFGATLIIGGKGQAFFEVDSPCVEKSDVAESVTKPNAPTYEGMEHIPRPNVRSDFWSAGAP